MNNCPDISVIMSVYNSEKYIEETIESILNQSFTNFELLVIDDASTDNTLKLILKYKDKRIKLYKNKKNLGYVINLNYLMSQSVGKYIARHDADDISHKDRLYYQFKVLENDISIDVCGTSAISFGDKSRFMYVYQNNDYIRSQMFFANGLIHPTIMYKRELLNRFDFYYNNNYKPTEDYSLWTNLPTSVNFFNISHPLLKYRLHSSNASVINDNLINKINSIRYNYYKLNNIELSLDESIIISKFIFNLNVNIDVVTSYLNIYHRLTINKTFNSTKLKNIYFLYIIKFLIKQRRFKKELFSFLYFNINISNIFFILSYLIKNKFYSLIYKHCKISNFG
jgi:glycosyltransferase involved in cell wall biosynthesis